MITTFQDPRAQENLRQTLMNQQIARVHAMFGTGTPTGSFYTQIDPNAYKYGQTGLGFYAPDRKGGFSSVPDSSVQWKSTPVKKGSTLDPNAAYYSVWRGTQRTSPTQITDPRQLSDLMNRGLLYTMSMRQPERYFTSGTYDYTKPFSAPEGWMDAKGNAMKAGTAMTPDEFYGGAKQAYLNTYLPQYQTELGQTQNSLLGNMASRGLLRSSVRSGLSDILSGQANRQYQMIQGAAQNYADSLKQTRSQAEQNLVSGIQAASDPGQAASNAWNIAQSYTTPPTMQPVSDLIGTFANTYLANRAAQPYGTSYMGYYAPGGYNPLLMGMSTGWLPKQ